MIAPASRKLGKYEIRQKLGRGGMGDVYLAQDTESGRPVALKLIEHGNDEDTRASIEAEMRGATLQASLADIDPRVARVYGAGDLDGYFHVAMEYIDGQDLAELMRGGKLEMEFACDVALAVAQTLENAHKLETSIGGKRIHGIVHGDIKPKNIRIDSRGNVRVLDFGIAKALSMSRKLTRNEFGSVPYASPERLESGEVNVGSDLWSLAVMLYEMVTGLQPYDAESTERLEKKIRAGIPSPAAPEPCPEPLRRILMKALAPDPELRYQTASEFGMELAAFRAGGNVRAVKEDLDATRRAFRPSDAGDETRRTAPADETRRTVDSNTAPKTPPIPPETPETKTPPAPARKPKGDLFYWINRGIAATVVGCVAYAAWAGLGDYQLFLRGRDFERQITSEQLTDTNEIWNRWVELSKDNPSSIFLSGPRQAAREKFVAAADTVIAGYRSSGEEPSLQTWQGAHSMLLHALSTEPDDKILHGKLRVCEGHSSILSGEKHRSRLEVNGAVPQFQEAGKLMPESPDPPLGLARVYFSLRDVDKEADAFNQAEGDGYRIGNAQRMQLADGYSERADRMQLAAETVRGIPPEKEQLQQAAKDYQRALDLYQKCSGSPNAAERINEVQEKLESVNTRLQEIERGPLEETEPETWRRKILGWIWGNKSTKRGR
jgi:serine/threonine protein kinase